MKPISFGCLASDVDQWGGRGRVVCVCLITKRGNSCAEYGPQKMCVCMNAVRGFYPSSILQRKMQGVDKASQCRAPP